MVLIIVIALLALAGAILLYNRRRLELSEAREHRQIPPRQTGLFDEAPPQAKPMVDTPSYRREKLLDRARNGDLDTLAEAWNDANRATYDDVLNELIATASVNRDLLPGLLSYISDSDHLRANKRLALISIEEWKNNPTPASTGKMAHIAALSDDPSVYEHAVDLIADVWKEGKLPQLSAEQLIEIVESQYWILADEARHSGEGFSLKFKFLKLRRELAAASRLS